MKQDGQKIIEETRRLCRQSWLIRIRAIRAVEESKALTDQLKKNIQAHRKQKERLKENSEYSLF